MQGGGPISRKRERSCSRTVVRCTDCVRKCVTTDLIDVRWNVSMETCGRWEVTSLTSTHCNILQHAATHCNTLQTATHCDTLQHTATHCNTLRHTATHCNALQRTAWRGHTSSMILIPWFFNYNNNFLFALVYVNCFARFHCNDCNNLRSCTRVHNTHSCAHMYTHLHAFSFFLSKWNSDFVWWKNMSIHCRGSWPRRPRHRHMGPMQTLWDPYIWEKTKVCVCPRCECLITLRVIVFRCTRFVTQCRQGWKNRGVLTVLYSLYFHGKVECMCSAPGH